MSLRQKTQSSGIDWITLSIYISLIVIGWLMLYATTNQEFSENVHFQFNSTIGRQTIWIIISLALFFFSLLIDWKFWNTLAYPIFAFSLLLLVAVLIFGTEIKGAKAWFSFAGFSFQPAEFAKFGAALGVSAYLSYFRTNLKVNKHILAVTALIFLPMFLIVLQPDVGSALVFVSFFILLFRQGLSPTYFIVVLSFALTFILSFAFSPYMFSIACLLLTLLVFIHQVGRKALWWLAFLGIAGSFFILLDQGLSLIAISLLVLFILIFSIILWQKRKQQLIIITIPFISLLIAFSFGTKYAFEKFLKPHQQDRINVWLNPEESDPRGSLYNLMQSKLAISAGGFKGKGFLEGTMTKLNYVPEQTTDFIFSTIGEEQGFIGSAGVIILFTILIIRISKIAERARHKFIMNYAYGLAGLLFAHYFINIGMTMGLMPVIGIPLPFISKGGSSLMIFSIMMGILLRMDLARLRGT